MKKTVNRLLAMLLALTLMLCFAAQAEPAGTPETRTVEGVTAPCFADSEGGIPTHAISGEAVDVAADGGAVKNDSGEYHVIVRDMDGNPVEGAVIQFCDDVTCTFQPTDASGVATFSVEEQKVYDIHVLMALEGYAPDDGVYNTLDTFSDVNIFLEKAA